MRYTLKTMSKKQVAIISVTILAVAVLSTYTYVSVSAWNDIGARVKVEQATTARLTKIFFADNDGASSQSRKGAIETLSQDTPLECEPGWLIGWQSAFIGGARATVEKCNAFVAKQELVRSKTKNIANFYDDERKLADILSSLAVDKKKLAPSLYKPTSVTVSEVINGLESAQFTNQKFVGIKSEALSRLEPIETTWSALIKAHESKNRAKYDKATMKLSDAYKQVNSISKVVSTAYAEEVKELAGATDNL
jgi:hypothetical protein